MRWSGSQNKGECYIVLSLCSGSKQRSPMEVFQAGGHFVGVKLPLEGTVFINSNLITYFYVTAREYIYLSFLS